MAETRNNHYVPEWYQKGFLSIESEQLLYLDLDPKFRNHPNGRITTIKNPKPTPISKCFVQKDLYTTFFGELINDEIEKKLFGEIDNRGAKAVRAFIALDKNEWHKHFSHFFTYIDAQKTRTPKGLQWIKNHYPQLNQIELMQEMQAILTMNCTIWGEGVREIVTATNSTTKFILSDHPVTIYNQAYPPESSQCYFPNDPSIALIGTQTIFALDMNHCIIFTNYEYAKNPNNVDPIQNRINAQNFRNSLVRTDAFIRSRTLTEDEVRNINFIIKKRAQKFIAASQEEWLYPDHNFKLKWSSLKNTLLPVDLGLFLFGGEIYLGKKNGSVYYQDAFGRTAPENLSLSKLKGKAKIGPNDLCECGSGIKFKKCCREKIISDKPSSKELSIRERNLFFCNKIKKILGLSNNKTWTDVQTELTDEQVIAIHQLYSDLWPKDTDLISLLPKPDKNLRALYTGIIDPSITIYTITNLTHYFDEIIIQNPFINPISVRPEFSPILNPQQYKLETLKNVYLLLTFEPYIKKGYINFIPDVCSFNQYLHFQMLSMAEKRLGSYFISEKDKDYKILIQLQKDDLERLIMMLPKYQQRKQIKIANPNLSENDVDLVIGRLDEKKQSDPFIILQDKIGGQIIKTNMIPNFEISLFLSQLIGSALLTDSSQRWKEITESQYNENGKVAYSWPRICDVINSLDFTFYKYPEDIFQLRKFGNLAYFRKGMRELYAAIQEDLDPIKSEALLKKIEKEFIKSTIVTKNEIENPKEKIFKCKFRCLIPKGGIVNNNVQRLLLTSSNSNYLNNVSMAIFVEYI